MPSGLTGAHWPVGPSRSVHETFSGSRVARRRHDTSSPNQTVASLHSPRRLISSTSYSGPEKCFAKSLAGPSLIAPAATCRAGRLPEIGPGSVILERSSTLVTTRPAVRIEMQPGTGGDRERLGSCSNRENAIGDVVDRGVITESTAHALIEIDGQHVGASGQRQRIAADAGAEIDDEWTRRIAWLCAGQPAPRSPVRRRSARPTFAGRART